MTKNTKFAIIMLCIFSFAIGGMVGSRYGDNHKIVAAEIDNELAEACFWYGVESAADILKLCNDIEDDNERLSCIEGGLDARSYKLKAITK